MQIRTLSLLAVLAIGISGCEVIGAIFEAGVWVGAIIVVAILALVGFAFTKLRR